MTQQWKGAKIKVLDKKKYRTECSNYRGISGRTPTKYSSKSSRAAAVISANGKALCPRNSVALNCGARRSTVDMMFVV